MNRPRVLGIVFVCLVFPTCLPAQEGNAPKLGVTFANEPWTLAFDTKDFSVKTNGLQSDGRIYLLAENQKTMVTLSVYLERIPGAATASDCQATQKARLDQPADYKREKVETKQFAGMEIVEYTIPEFSGAPIQQRNLFACLPKDDVYVDIHLSKALFKPDDEKLFTAILTSAHFISKSVADTK